MEIRTKIINPLLQECSQHLVTNVLPVRQTPGSAGIDLFACMDEMSLTLRPEEIHTFHTGIAVAIPEGYCGLIVPRSGLGGKGLVLANGTGVIDSDYRGELLVKLWNRNPPGFSRDHIITIERFQRIAQLLIVPVAPAVLVEVDDLDDTERGEGGFGSTGHG